MARRSGTPEKLSASEPGCLHCAFSFNGSVAHCREGYDNAAAVLAHLETVGALLGEALKLSQLTKLEVHGPAADIDKLREPMAGLAPQFFAPEPGFRRA